MSGWLKLHRRLQDNSMWTAEPFTRGQAWVDLLMLANYKSGHVRVRGRRIDLERGQLAHSRQFLAKRWQWSKGKVNRYLTELQTDRQVILETGHDFSVVSICNYEKYNDGNALDGSPNEPPNDPQTGHETGHETGHKREEGKESKEGKEVKKGKRNPRASRRSRLPDDPVVELPDWMPKDLWLKYLKSREDHPKKHPMSEHFLGLAVDAIEKLTNDFTVEQIMEPMIQNGWRSVQKNWIENFGVEKKSSTHGGYGAKNYADDAREQGFANVVGGGS